MKNSKITQGHWSISHGDTGLYIESEKSNFISIKNNEEVMANAELISDAGNTFNKTGLTPSELLLQRDYLLEACNAFVELFKDSDMRPEDECHELYGKIKEAIEKTA